VTEREKLEMFLEEVKQKIQMLDAIEERLLDMRDLVMKSTEVKILGAERRVIQKEIDILMGEIKMLELDETMHQ